MSLELVLAIIVFIVEQAIMIGVMKANQEHNAKDIEDLKARHQQEIAELKARQQQDIYDVYNRINTTDKTLSDIQGMIKSVDAQIKSVDEKVDLIIAGKIQV